ncbi:MAG: DUF1499 domain-containing protein [Paracoccaceae bacterium]
MRRLTWLLVLSVVVTIGAAVAFRVIGHDPAIWHVDPATTERTGRDNDYLIAPEGAANAEIDTVFTEAQVAARDLLFLFDSIASNASRTRPIAGSVDELHITYLQQSLVFGFPDYVSVKAVETPDGAGLVIWSRSRFGFSDMGANKSRVDGWLAAMGG